MRKLIPIIAGMLLLCIWSGMFVAIYGELPPINGQWKSYQIAFVMIETPLMIILFGIGFGGVLAVWKMLNKE